MAALPTTSEAAYAFVTLLTTDEYLPAALVVAHSLRLAHAQSSLLSDQDSQALAVSHDDHAAAHNQLGPWKRNASSTSQSSNIHLVVLVTPATLSVQTIRLLLAVFDRVIGVEPIGVESILAMQQLGQIQRRQEQQPDKGQQQASLHGQDIARSSNDNLTLLGRLDLGSHSGAALTKLHAWRLTDYEKIVYLDADTLVLNPLAHLFTYPHRFAAAPDTGWPDIFNSGVMLLTPREATFTDLLQLAASTGSWDGADQGVLNEYFGGEIGSGGEGPGGGWARLGFIYNTTALGGYTYAPAFRRFGSKVNVAHFIGENKPWRDRSSNAVYPASPRSGLGISARIGLGDSGSDNQGMAARWWDVYNSYYPTTTSSASNGNDSDSELEVKITETGVEIVERRKGPPVRVPTFQAAWNSAGDNVGESTFRTGATVEELKAMFHTDSGARIPSVRPSEGRYESLPLFGRLDLLAPIFAYVAATKVATPPTPTPQRRDFEYAWDAAVGPPPSITGPEGHQMREPIDAFYPNAWDHPVDPQAEAERRRQFFNGNARAQAEGRGWGYIPPEARQIHTFSHLGGERPDEQKVKAVFPWEDQRQRRSPPPPSSRKLAQGPFEGDSSLGPAARAPFVTRRFDDYVVGAASRGAKNNASLVSRYGNVWDEAGLTVGPQLTLTSPDVADENERRSSSFASAGPTARRRQTSKPQDAGGLTRSRPTSHYVPNNYDQYEPAPPQAPAGLSSAASDCSIDDSINDEHNYLQQLGGIGGGGALLGVGGFGEVEGSGSWTSSLTNQVRLGKIGDAAPLASGRSGGTGQAGGSRRVRVHGGGMSGGSSSGQVRYGGLEADDDGDDESSTEEDNSRPSSINPRSRQSTLTSEPSQRLGTTTGTGPPFAGSPSSSVGGAMSPPLVSLSTPTSATTSSSGTASSATTAMTASSAPLAISGTPSFSSSNNREGPGYARKSQQSEYVRANLTPRSPRSGGMSGSVSGTFNSNATLPSTSPPLLLRSTSGTLVAERIAQLQAAGSPPRTSASAGAGAASAGVGVGRPLGPQGSVKASVAAASAPPASTPAPPLTGRARIRPEKFGGHTQGGAAGGGSRGWTGGS